jgi:hypothetical protein
MKMNMNPKRQRFDFVLKNSKFENETENEVASEYQQEEENVQEYDNYQEEETIKEEMETTVAQIQTQNENEELFVVKKKIDSIYERVNALQTR